jgi:hypothetical protein
VCGHPVALGWDERLLASRPQRHSILATIVQIKECGTDFRVTVCLCMGTSSIEQGTKTTENLNRNIMAQLFTNAQ